MVDARVYGRAERTRARLLACALELFERQGYEQPPLPRTSPDPVSCPLALDALTRQLALTLVTALLAFPAAWASTLGRGLLPGIATTILLVVVAQVVVIAGAGAWFPVAAPALWALTPSTVSLAQLALVLVVPIAFGLLTTRSWSRLQLDR